MPAAKQYLMSYPAYAETLRQALVEDPFYIAIEQITGGGEAGRLALLRYLDYSIVEGERYGLSHFPGEQAYGVSVWSKPLEEKLASEQKETKNRFLKQQIGEAYFDCYQSITQFMSAQSNSLVDSSAWYLSIIGVLPDFQNQGLGVNLVKDVLSKTDALQLPTFLETFTPRNETFYQRLGYRVVARPFEPTLQSAYAVMVRDGTVTQTQE